MIEKLGLNKVINASGKMSVIGVSIPSQTVVDSMSYGASNYFEMEDLHEKAGEYLASICNFEAARVVSSASSGIAQSVASVICKDKPSLYKNPYDPNYTQREIIIPKGQNINFGAPIETMIELGGGLVKEAGYSNSCTQEDIISKITDKTAALFYVKSHHAVQKSMLRLDEMMSISKEYKLPLIVDAAAEEDFSLYSQKKIDFIIFSGSKAIEGPTSGIVFGKTESISWMKHQESGLGRAMKVGKESIFGLLKAVEEYLSQEAITKEEQYKKLEPFIDQLNEINGISAKIVKDESGREIYRARLTYQNMPSLVKKLKEGSPSIYTRDYNMNIGMIDLDIRALKENEYSLIIKKIEEALNVRSH